MSNFEYPDSGALFQNDYKDSERKPDWKGEANWRGEKIELAGWNKTTRDGRPFISVKISLPYERDGQ